MAKIFIAPASRMRAVLRLRFLDSEIEKTEGQLVRYRRYAASAEERLCQYRKEAAALKPGLEAYRVG